MEWAVAMVPSAAITQAAFAILSVNNAARAGTGGVVIASDSGTSSGSFIVSRMTDKLPQLTEKIYCCRLGSAADTQALANIVACRLTFQEIQEGRLARVRIVAKLFTCMCYYYRDDTSAGIILAVYDLFEGGSGHDGGNNYEQGYFYSSIGTSKYGNARKSDTGYYPIKTYTFKVPACYGPQIYDNDDSYGSGNSYGGGYGGMYVGGVCGNMFNTGIGGVGGFGG